MSSKLNRLPFPESAGVMRLFSCEGREYCGILLNDVKERLLIQILQSHNRGVDACLPLIFRDSEFQGKGVKFSALFAASFGYVQDVKGGKGVDRFGRIMTVIQGFGSNPAIDLQQMMQSVDTALKRGVNPIVSGYKRSFVVMTLGQSLLAPMAIGEQEAEAVYQRAIYSVLKYWLDVTEMREFLERRKAGAASVELREAMGEFITDVEGVGVEQMIASASIPDYDSCRFENMSVFLRRYIDIVDINE